MQATDNRFKAVFGINGNKCGTQPQG